MSNKVSQHVPIVPVALSSNPDDPTIPDIAHEGDSSFQVRRVHGRCAPFCANDGVPTDGASVAEHGEMCRSSHVINQSVPAGDGGRKGHLFGALSIPYLHGVYRWFDASQAEWRPYVELSVDLPIGDDSFAEGELYLTAEEAREMAAGLMRMADEIEFRDEPISGQRDRRPVTASQTGVQA